jgi:hypothetical protein
MENVTEFTVKTFESEEIYVLIDRGNGEFTSMTKAHYDELEATQENGTIS